MSTATLERRSTQTDSVTPQLHWRTHSSASVDQAMSDWTSIAGRLNNRSITADPGWIHCWLKHYGDLVPHRFVTAHANGLVRGIALLTQGVDKKDGPFPVRTIHLGTAGEPQQGSVCVEYNRLLVDQEFTTPFLAGLFETVFHDTSWEQCCLDGFSETDLLELQSYLPEASIHSRDSKYFNLHAAREQQVEILSLLGKSTRSNIRRRLKKYGTLEVEWADSSAQAEEIQHELIQLHQARWNAVGLPGAFANDRFLNFQRSLISKLFREGKVVLFRVRHEGETVGCLQLLVDENRLLDYLSGFASFESKPSIGLITHYLCMTEALKRGYAAYDFLVGDKQHKDNLSTDVNQLCWLTYRRPSLKTRSLQILRNVKQLMRATQLKQLE